MFIQINQLYLNTEKIETLGIYEIPTEEYYEIGLLVNDIRYCMYHITGNNMPIELMQEVQFYVSNLVQQIVEQARVEVKQLTLPPLDMSKYIQPTVEETPIPVEKEKEQIND